MFKSCSIHNLQGKSALIKTNKQQQQKIQYDLLHHTHQTPPPTTVTILQISKCLTKLQRQLYKFTDTNYF